MNWKGIAVFWAKWFVATMAIVGVVASYAFVRVNMGDGFEIVTPQYPQKVDWGYTMDEQAAPKSKVSVKK